MNNSEEPAVQAALEQLTHLLADNEIIQAYQQISRRVESNETLARLQEEIKTAQKEAVSFAHYGKPEAEKQALKQADALTKQLNEHPLVIAYRSALAEANDLLQHLTNLIQTQINDAIKEDTNAAKN